MGLTNFGLLFPLGRIVATPGAIELFEETHMVALDYIQRHVSGDWGELDEHDQEANRAALVYGTRILSNYPIGERRLWIITEADRSATTLLLPEEEY